MRYLAENRKAENRKVPSSEGSDADVLGTNKDFGCVIDNADYRMRIPLISFNIDENISCILNICAASSLVPDRAKPVIAITRGMGSGKTRAIEECRLALIKTTTDTLALAVTFNNKTSLATTLGPQRTLSQKVGLFLRNIGHRARDAATSAFRYTALSDQRTHDFQAAEIYTSLDDWGPYVDGRSSYALSVSARMACALFAIDFVTCVRMLKDRLSEVLPIIRCGGHYSGQEILRAFLSLAIAKMAEAGQPVKKFVLMVDECQKIEHYIEYAFGIKQITSTLTQALLDNDIGNGVGVAVVLSMADVSPSGITYGTSGRSVVPLKLPQSLDIDQLVDSCWEMGHLPNDDLGKHSLKLFAALLNKTPRLMEIARGFILDSRAKDRERAIDARYLSELLDHVSKKVDSRYYAPRLPSFDVMYSIIFNDHEVGFNKSLMTAISHSIVTNQIEFFLTSEGGNVALKPEASLFMLRKAAFNTTDNFMAKQLRDCFDKVFQFILSTAAPNEGDLLELVYREWLLVRLDAARLAVSRGIIVDNSASKALKRRVLDFLNYDVTLVDSAPMTLARILGLGGYRHWGDFEGEVRKIFEVPLFMGSDHLHRCAPLGLPIQLRHCSWDADPTAYLRELNSVKVTATSPVAMIVPTKSSKNMEAWDLCLKVLYVGATDEPQTVFIFIDNKAMEERPNREQQSVAVQPQSTKKMPKKGSQYSRTEDVIGKRFPFLFIYATTYNIVTYSTDRAIYMGKSETLAMLGPFAELCRVGRCQAQLHSGANSEKGEEA